MPDTTATQVSIPRIGIFDKIMLARGMFDTNYFMHSVRPMMYGKCNNDPELVNELVLDTLKKNGFGVQALSGFFNAPDELKIGVNGNKIVPFGSAAGIDKTGDSLLPLSNIFGFLEPGTICVNPREGNARPRMVADEPNFDMYNAQGFPGKGLGYFLNNIAEYRKRGGKVPVYVNICGMPLSEQNAIELAMDEMRELLKKLEPYADGFVWNCASPNTEALKKLREPQIFNDTSKLMKELAPNKLRVVKMWPYEPEDREASLGFVRSFLEGGGHGVVTTNTKMFPKEQIPAQNWGYKSGGRSGLFLKPYRLRSVRDIRGAFPDALIVATGGIYSGDDAYETFKAGANMLEGYTPYTFYGLGLLREIEKGVLGRLKADGYRDLAQLQADAKKPKQ